MDTSGATSLVARRRPAGDRLIGLEYISELTNTPKDTFYAWKCRKKLPFPVVMLDRRIRAWESDVLAWIDSRTQTPVQLQSA
jgi:predicted DNA-binding transcriptional regulator AlpA